MEQTKTSKLVSVLLAFVLSFSMLGTASLGIFADTAYAAQTPAKIVLTKDTDQYPVSKLVLFNGESTDIDATVLGTDGTEFKANGKSVNATFKSDDVNLVSVTETGLIAAKAVTTSPVKITASYEGVSATCEVEVTAFAFKDQANEFVGIDSTPVSGSYDNTYEWDEDGESTTAPIIVDFEDTSSSDGIEVGTDKKAIGDVSFHSDNENVVTANTDGTITVKGPGVATVTAAVNFTYKEQKIENKVAKSIVVVTNPPTSVSLSPASPVTDPVFLSKENKTFAITAKVAGDLRDGGGKDLALNEDTTYTWSADKEGIVSFSPAEGSAAEGSVKTVVTALQPGKVNVTCTAQSGIERAFNDSANQTERYVVVVNGLGLWYTELNFASSKLGDAHKKEIAAALYNNADSSSLDAGLTWETSDEAVAKVVKEGDHAWITAVGPGSATITAKYTDNNGNKYTATCLVTVDDPISAITVTVDKPRTPSVYDVGDKGTLTAELTDSNGDSPSLSQAGGTIRWVSTDPSVVAVNGNGATASFEVLKPGKATIKAFYNSGAEGAEDVSTSSTYPELLAKGIAVNPGSVKLNVDKKTATLSLIEVTTSGSSNAPSDAADTEWVIEEGGNDVIRINGSTNVGATASITALGGGTATVTAKYKNSKSVIQTATCKVTVENPATAITVDPAQVTLDQGATSQLTASTEGPLGKDTKVTDTISWATSDEKVATVDENGLVTAVGAGSATITATAGNVNATCAVTVNDPTPPTPESVTMYRLYNPNSGEHFFTVDAAERDMLVNAGWDDEGNGAPVPTSGKAVYRLYNQYGSEHHYTLDEGEVAALVAAGWTDEGVAFYSADETGTPMYRVYNPNAYANNHHYTPDENEKNYLINIGWRGEGIGWYGV